MTGHPRPRRAIAKALLQRSLAVVLWAALSSGVHGETPAVPYDYQLKTVYLFKFTEYVEWPSASSGPLRLCFWERNPFPEATAAALSAWKGSRELTTAVVSSQDVTGRCDLLYVPTEQTITPEKISAFAATGTLVVGEEPAFLTAGGMIQFVSSNQAIAFDINLSALRGASLKMSSALLRVARRVEES